MTQDNFDLKDGTISFSQIDWADTTYRITYHRPIDSLVRSIEAIGLQQSPVLQEKKPGRYCIVAGYRRFQALQKINLTPVPCRIAPPETKTKDLFLFNFYHNADRGFNVVELSWVVTKLSDFLEEGELIHRYLPLLGLPPRKETVARLLRQNEISQVYWPSLLQGRLFPETVDTVVRDFSTMAHFILALFIFLHWGFQKQKEFLSDLKSICVRRGEEPEEFLFASSITALLHQSRWTSQQKGESLRNYFRTFLFPILTETEKRFKEMISSLPLDTRTRVYPPPFFEGGRYGLDIRFSNPNELKTSMEKIRRVLEEGKLDELP